MAENNVSARRAFSCRCWTAQPARRARARPRPSPCETFPLAAGPRAGLRRGGARCLRHGSGFRVAFRARTRRAADARGPGSQSRVSVAT